MGALTNTNTQPSAISGTSTSRTQIDQATCTNTRPSATTSTPTSTTQPDPATTNTQPLSTTRAPTRTTQTAPVTRYPHFKEEKVYFLPLNKEHDTTRNNYRHDFVSIFTSHEPISVCALCLKQYKKYFRLPNHSIFMNHFRHVHQLKLGYLLPINCPYCNEGFNTVRAVEQHCRSQHGNYFSRKIWLRDFKQQLTDKLNKANIIDWQSKVWRTKLQEVECFASMNYVVTDCITCPLSKIQSKPAMPQFEDLITEKMTQITQPNLCIRHPVTPDDFLAQPEDKVLIGRGDRFQSAFFEKGKPKKRKYWEYC